MLRAGFPCAGSYADPSIQNKPRPDRPLMSETVKNTISRGTGPIGTPFWWALVVLLALITVAAGLVVTAVFPTLNGEGIVAVVGLLIVVNAAIVSIALLRAGNHRSPASGEERTDR
jgi:hypothetical protein